MANQEHLKILKQGVAAWNKWRRDRSIIPDFSNADLNGTHLTNANLSGANLNNANLSGVNLFKADFSIYHISTEITWKHLELLSILLSKWNNACAVDGLV